MLLDQKRTRRMVQIVSVLTSLAFAGVIFVVLGLIFFGGGGNTVADQQLSDAKTLVEKEPKSADAWEGLASAYTGAEQPAEAVAAAKKAVALDPQSFRRLQTLVSLQLTNNETDAAITVVSAYSTKHPKNTEALLQLAQLAEAGGKTDLARLSYQAFLQKVPDDPNADAIKAKLKTLSAAS